MKLTTDILEKRIAVAAGRVPADLVIKNAEILSTITGTWWHGDIALCGDRIAGVGESYSGEVEIDATGLTVVPGFVDSHVHIESTKLTPYEFERAVMPHGVTTAFCDPHEMANVCGAAALRYFLDCAEGMAMDLFVQLSSCVPATHLETAGASLSAGDLLEFRGHRRVHGLGEVMNYPGVIAGDEKVLEKIAIFGEGAVDGHAPLLTGRDLNAYIAAGIRNDHECCHAAEAIEKLRKGMRVLLRSGSAASSIAPFFSLLTWQNAGSLGFCTDDLSISDICERGTIDEMVRGFIRLGIDPRLVYRIASLSGAEIFGLRDRGIIAPGYMADLIVLDDVEHCRIRSVIKAGNLVSPEMFAARAAAPACDFARNSVRREVLTIEQIRVPASELSASVPVIGVVPDSLLTERLDIVLPTHEGALVADSPRDICKLVVAERHGKNGNLAVSWVRGLGFLKGALASTVAHDSHNLCAAGTDDEAIVQALNSLIACGGGLCVADATKPLSILPLPIAGLMSDAPFEEVYAQSLVLKRTLAENANDADLPNDILASSQPHDPFMTLSFLSLPVIPHLKLTDKGLVDVDAFTLL